MQTERDKQHHDVSEELRQLRAELATERAEMEVERELLQAERQSLEALRTALETQCEEHSTGHERPDDQADAQTTCESTDPHQPQCDSTARAETLSPSAEDGSPRSLAEQPVSPQPSDAAPCQPAGEAPNCTVDVLQRFRAMGAWHDDAAEQSQSECDSPGPAASEPEVDQQSEADEQATTPQAETSHEEESIEEYMAKLLQRVRGKEEAKPQAASRRVERRQPEPQPEPKPPEPVPSDQPSEPFKIAPRALPPELTSNLTAMRELANFSTRTAIGTSVRQRWLTAALGKLAVSLAGFACGGILLRWAVTYHDPAFFGASIGILIGIFWGVQGGFIFSNVVRAKRHADSLAKENPHGVDDSEQQVPDDLAEQPAASA